MKPAQHPAANLEARPTSQRAPVGGGAVALWILLALNLAWFVPFAVSTGVGIIEGVLNARVISAESGGADAGGVQWGLMNILGPVLLGLALAYGLYRYYSRNRQLDPAGEESAKDQYDHPQVGKLDS